jgi:ATP-dependent protease HslVU (ClpYQ) peptidase subunit
MLDTLTTRLAGIVKQLRGEARLTEANIQEALREVRIALLEADVALPVVKHFIDAVRECLKNRGWAAKRDERESGGCFLVGYKGRLFRIDDDYQVGIPADGFAAVGCGDQIAHGALYASAHLNGRERLELALRAAERFSAGVRGPFHIESLSDEAKT